METIRTNTIIKADGHLSIDIPTTFEEGEVEIIIIIESKTKSKQKYNFLIWLENYSGTEMPLNLKRK